MADLIYNEVPPLVKIWTWIMWHQSNYFFVRLRPLSTLTVCITNSCHWSFHLITVIWSIILDWPNHTSHNVTYFIYHCVDAPLSLKITIKVFPLIDYWWFIRLKFSSQCLSVSHLQHTAYDMIVITTILCLENHKSSSQETTCLHLPLIQSPPHYQVQATKSKNWALSGASCLAQGQSWQKT